MGYNPNAGFGKLIAESLAKKPYTGNWFIVATSSVAGWNDINEIFNSADGKGVPRTYTTLRECLDSGYVEDGNDDVIFVMPNHTETCTSAGSLDTGTTASGLSIVGLGEADERPLITFSGATTADFDIGSNGVTIENMRFDLTGIDALAAPFDINDTGFTMRNCEIIQADSAGQAVLAILTDANAGYMTIDNCYIHGQGTGGKTAIRIVGGTDHLIKNCVIDGLYKITTGCISVTTTAAGLVVKDCDLRNRTASSTAVMDFKNGSTAIITGCSLSILSGTAPITLNEGVGGTGGNITVAGNYYNAVTTVTAGTLL